MGAHSENCISRNKRNLLSLRFALLPERETEMTQSVSDLHPENRSKDNVRIDRTDSISSRLGQVKVPKLSCEGSQRARALTHRLQLWNSTSAAAGKRDQL